MYGEYRYRELNRIALELEGTELENNLEIKDRLHQLNEGIIFYPRRWWEAQWNATKKLVTLSCPVCCFWHFTGSLHKVFSEKHTMTCCYGWWYLVRHYLTWGLGPGQNGDD